MNYLTLNRIFSFLLIFVIFFEGPAGDAEYLTRGLEEWRNSELARQQSDGMKMIQIAMRRACNDTQSRRQGQLKIDMGHCFGTSRHTHTGWKGMEAKALVRMNYFQVRLSIPMPYRKDACVEYWNTITGWKLHLTKLCDLHGGFHTNHV